MSSHDSRRKSKEAAAIVHQSTTTFSGWRCYLLLAPLSLLLLFHGSFHVPLTLFPPAAGGFHNTSRVAVCLVGGARRFELTGPSIVNYILQTLPSADLFLHSPLDKDAYKLSLLRSAPRVAAVKIFRPVWIEETAVRKQVMSAHGSPNGLQGLLQYFNLVEGCLTLIEGEEVRKNSNYDWILRARLDSYWSAPLNTAAVFLPGVYVTPVGSQYNGLNDRLGAGDRKTSRIGLSRLSLLSQLDSLGYAGLNSESAFMAQFSISNVRYTTARVPFCVLSDRWSVYPPGRFGLPVASVGSRGPLNGAYCRPCTPACVGQCAKNMTEGLERRWNWIEWTDGSSDLCEATGPWDPTWERIFDQVAGEEAARVRRKVKGMRLDECVAEMEELKKKATAWESPEPAEICREGLGGKMTASNTTRNH